MSLLADRIKKYQLPACPYEPTFDRIIIYTLPESKADRETFVPGGKILKLDIVADAERKESPRGILMAAGLEARDILRGHGIDLGHIVWVARFSPWRHEIELTATGKTIEMMFMRAGDIVGSEDVKAAVDKGLIIVKYCDDGKHRYDMDESVVPRFDPKKYVDE